MQFFAEEGKMLKHLSAFAALAGLILYLFQFEMISLGFVLLVH
jgi:hypothetical protein